MSSLVNGFHPFPRLPLELRDKTWELCLPHRVYELDWPCNFAMYASYDSQGLTYHNDSFPCNLKDTTFKNGRPPAISRVCRESRSVTLKAGHMIDDFFSRQPEEAEWYSGTSNEETWQDPTRDMAHLNWSSAYEADFGSEGRPIHSLVWTGGQSCGTASLMIWYLDEYFNAPDPFGGNVPPRGTYAVEPLEPDMLSELEALSQLEKCLVVIRTLVVHCDLQTAAMTGFFGLLGDAPVQIVDLAEEAKIENLIKFAEACERTSSVHPRQRFHREFTTLIEQQLGDLIMWRYHSEELVMKMRPAIMFRLCTQMCNHVAEGD